ncbi:AAA family ATPase [Pseudoclavibacter helvolus]|uniref:AAA family ATPase n=1 Tax=Pseudoclavibacter helvolus TaxID=255205 RepID=UPI003C752BEA
MHRESVLARYVNGAPVVAREHPHPRLFPLPFNLSQRQAVEHALSFQVSVVEGGPGMGKTQVVANVVANLLAQPGASVAVVAADDAGVEEVRERLREAGMGVALAGLGAAERRDAFFASQASGNEALAEFLAAASRGAAPGGVGSASSSGAGAAADAAGRLAWVDEHLLEAQRAERRRAELHAEVAACRLELDRFRESAAAGREPDLTVLPRLAAAHPELAELVPREGDSEQAARFSGIPFFQRDASASDRGDASASDRGGARPLVEAQAEFYRCRLVELEGQLSVAAQAVERMGAPELVDEHLALSAGVLEAALRHRYEGRVRRDYAAASYWKELEAFLRDYPVVLSSSAELAGSLTRGVMVDSLVVDGGSGLDLLTAAGLLACTRHLVVVGGGEPFALAREEAGAYEAAPRADVGPYDVGQYSLQSSLVALYGASLRRVELRAD